MQHATKYLFFPIKSLRVRPNIFFFCFKSLRVQPFLSETLLSDYGCNQIFDRPLSD